MLAHWAGVVIGRKGWGYDGPLIIIKKKNKSQLTSFFLTLANEFLVLEHSPLFFVDVIIHCSLLRTCRVRVEEKEEFLIYMTFDPPSLLRECLLHKTLKAVKCL